MPSQATRSTISVIAEHASGRNGFEPTACPLLAQVTENTFQTRAKPVPGPVRPARRSGFDRQRASHAVGLVIKNCDDEDLAASTSVVRSPRHAGRLPWEVRDAALAAGGLNAEGVRWLPRGARPLFGAVLTTCSLNLLGRCCSLVAFDRPTCLGGSVRDRAGLIVRRLG